MSNPDFNVILYSDGSQQAFSAAVYATTLLKNMPNMRLTVVQVQERDESSSSSSMGTKYNWIDTWPVSPTSEWMKRVTDESDSDTVNNYHHILTQTNEIFKEREQDVSHQVLYSNPSISDTVEALINFATKKSFRLIIMGTRGLTTLKGLVFGSLAHNVLNKSPIPVLLVKKLPQDFIDSYSSKTDS